MRSVVLLAVTLAIASTIPAFSDEAPRYRLERTADGFVRMDQVTGHISVCTEQDTGLVCRMAVDDRAAYEADIVALENRVKVLEDKMAGLNSAPSTVVDKDAEFETSLNQMERFFRRFLGIVREFSDDLGGKDQKSGDPVPDRT